MTKHSENRRDEIIRAAAHLFREKGFDKATVRDLGDLAGIKSGSLFHHFDTKLEILIAIMEETIEANKQYLVEKVSEAETPKEKIHNLIQGELELLFGERGDAAAVLIHEWQRVSLEDKKSLFDLRKEYEAIWTDVLADAKAAGLIAKDADVAILRRLLYGAIVWTSNWYKTSGKLDLEGLTHQILLLAVKHS